MKLAYRKSLLFDSSVLAINAVLTGAVFLVPEQTQAACTTVNSDTTISDSSNSCITWTGGTITITGSGVVSGSSVGVLNAGNIVGDLINSGSIDGSGYGIQNNGAIGTITNSDLISGNSYGIFNSTTIDTISNSGLISSAHGVFNAGSINTISNSGTINSGATGILNDTAGSIGTIDNNGGTISGATAGIVNGDGTIGTISNSGTLTGSLGGILNTSAGTIGAIINMGLITGQTDAIFSDGTILDAISNSGTIAGNINISQALTFTGGSSGALGTLTGFNGGAGTITTNDHDLTFDSNSFQLLGDDIDVGVGNRVFNNGTLRVNAPRTITGGYTQGASGLLVVGVSSASAYGKLVVSGSAVMTNGQVLITPTSGALVNGETFTIVQAADTGTDYTNVSATAAGFTASSSSIISGGFDELLITLTEIPGGGGSGGSGSPGPYATLGNAGGGGVAPAIGAALDQIAANIANGGDASFAPILAALNNLGQQSPQAEQIGITQLGPSQLSSQLTSTNTLMNQGSNVIAQHADNLVTGDSDSAIGMAAGSEYRMGVFWGQVSGGIAGQSSTPTLGGYNQTSYGLTVGADDHICKGTTLGLAFAWMHGDSTGKDSLAGTNVSSNSFQFTGYGTQRFGPAFVDGLLGIGYNRFDQNRAINFLGTTATANYGGIQYMARIQSGWDFALPQQVILTPMVGFQAVHTDNDSYTESGAGAGDLAIGRQIVNSYATTLGAKITTTFPTAWGELRPALKLGWVHDLNSSPVPTSGILGGVNFTTTTPRVAPDGAQATLALTLQKTDTLAIRAEYDGDIRSGFSSHTGLVKIEWNF